MKAGWYKVLAVLDAAQPLQPLTSELREPRDTESREKQQTRERQDMAHTNGAVWCNRSEVGPWETFTLAHVHNNIALWSHQGYFSAQDDGSVFANRSEIGPWESWDMEDNGDGTVSLRAIHNGNYLTAEGGGGSHCVANRSQKGPWEIFRLEHPPGGIALKAQNGNYVSVQH